MRICFGSIVLLHVFGAAIQSSAAQTGLVPYNVPAYKGYAISVSLPRGWENKIDPQRYWLVISSRPKVGTNKYALLQFQIRVFRKTKTFDEWVLFKIQNFKYYPSLKIYKRGFGNNLKNRTFYYTSSSKFINIDGKKAKASQPTSKVYISNFFSRVIVELGLTTRLPNDYQKLLPLFERVAKSVKIRPASEVPPGQLSRIYTSPNVQISLRRNYYLRTRFRLVLSPGWSARAVAVQHAGESGEQGKLMINVAPAKQASSGRDHRLMVAIEGMPVTTALGPKNYLAVGKAHVKSILSDAQLVPTPKSAEWTGQPGFGFCLARKRFPRGSGTRKIYVATYTGTDKQERRGKLRIYTAGGLTMACNVIYSADPKTFDASWERVYGMISSIKTDSSSPVLSVR